MMCHLALLTEDSGCNCCVFVYRDACLPLPWLLQPSVHHLQHAQAPQPPPKPEDAHIPTPRSAP